MNDNILKNINEILSKQLQKIYQYRQANYILVNNVMVSDVSDVIFYVNEHADFIKIIFTVGKFDVIIDKYKNQTIRVKTIADKIILLKLGKVLFNAKQAEINVVNYDVFISILKARKHTNKKVQW